MSVRNSSNWSWLDRRSCRQEKRRQGRCARFEQLESRQLLVAGIWLLPDYGTLLIAGSTADDTADVSDVDAQRIGATLDAGNGTITHTYLRVDVNRILFVGDLGNDDFTNSTDIPVVANGGGGHDQLQGGPGNDLLLGDDGNDELSGGAGSDLLSGGDDDDHLSGGDDDDALAGDAGNDVIEGGEGDDVLSGHLGNDILRGNAGQDLLLGKQDNDVLLGGPGDDMLHGSTGRDLLVGGDDFDQVFGNLDSDILIGGATIYDSDDAALRAILSEWTGPGNFADRMAVLEHPGFAHTLQPNVTVLDDQVADQLLGQTDADWFFLPGDGPAPGQHFVQFLNNLDQPLDLGTADAISSNLPHANNPTLRLEHFAVFALVDVQQATHTAVASGDWSSAATWDNGLMPVDEANVLVPPGVTVTVDTDLSDITLRTVRVQGRLRFDPSTNTSLKVDTLVADHNSVFEMGTAGAPIAADATARVIVADRGELDRVWDPLGLSRGVVLHGTVRVVGAEKTSSVSLAVSPRAGATQLLLAEPVVGWYPGDQIVVAGVDADQPQSELRTIQSINGDNVTLDAPLDFDHTPPANGLAVHAANVSRNAVFESQNAALGRRGHVMFMHTRHVDVNYAGFYHLGRTNKLLPANDAALTHDGKLEDGTGLNDRGRYPVHFHRNGVVNDGQPAKVHGSAVFESPGWGFVNHSSFVEFTDNVAYNVDGAAFVTEAGDEIGVFRGNTAIQSMGSGESINSRKELQDFGHQGDGFWFQGGGVVVEDNVASGHAGHGFIFATRGLFQDGLFATRFPTENLPDPSIANGAASINVSDVPIVNFRDNVAYASRVGAGVWFNKRHANHDQPSVLEDLLLWNNKTGANINYSRLVTVRNTQVIGDTQDLFRVGINHNSVSSSVTHENVHVEGYLVGMVVARRGTNVINGGFFNNLENIRISTALEADRSVLITGDVQFGELPGLAHAQRMVAMRADLQPVDESVEHVFHTDTVTLDFGAFRGRLYYFEQAGDFIPFPTADAFIPAEYVGKTNSELWAEFGLAVGGRIAPARALETAGLYGLFLPRKLRPLSFV